MKNNTIKILFTCLLLTASIFAFSQREAYERSVRHEWVNNNYKAPAFTVRNSLFTEDFANGAFPPAGWEIQGEGEGNWYLSATNNAGGFEPEASMSYSPDFTGVSRLVTPQIATSGYSELVFEMKHYLDDFIGGYTVKIETTSDGNTWNEIWSEAVEGDIGPETLQFVIDNDDVGSDNFQLAFTFDGVSFNVNNWYIDDIALSETLSYDAAVMSIDFPATMGVGDDYAPGAVVKNNGLETVTFNVTFEILDGEDPVYSEEFIISDLGSFESVSITFPSWIAIAGYFEAKVTASLTNDENPENDSMSKDVAVIELLFEDFESVVVPEIPEDWYKIVISNNSYANVKSFDNSGVDNSKCVRLVNVSDLDADLLLITPALDGGAANKYLQFYSWSYGSELSVGTMTDPTDITTYTELVVLDINNVNIMEEYEVYFDEYTGTDEHIAFKGIFNNPTGDIALDNVAIDYLQSCPAPSDLNVSEITQTSTLLEWVENGEADQWRIEYGEMGFTPSGNAMIYTDENPYLLEGLEPGTYYEFYVQAECDGGSLSNWVGPHFFATLCNASVSLPYTEGFEDVIIPFMPPCNAVENSNGDEWQWVSSDANPYSGENHAAIEPNNALQMDDWFFSPGLELEGGETYIVNFYYTSDSDSNTENIEVKFGTEANSASMNSEPIFEDIMFAYNNVYQFVNASFLADEDGTYFIGWHGFSDPGNSSIYIDDIHIEMKVDSLELEAPSNLTGPTEVQYNENITLNWEAPSTPSANFFEGFEGEFLPEGWSKFNLDGGTGWQALGVGSAIPGWSGGVATACPNGGLQQAYATWQTGGDPLSDQWLVTPQLIYSEGDTLGFWMGIYRDDWTEHLEVLISTTVPDDPEAFNTVVDIIDIPSGTPIGWTYYSYDLTGIVPDGTPIYIAFREYVENNYIDGNATSLDNISLGRTESKSLGNELLGYNIYHKYNSGVFEIIDYATDTTYTHISPDIGTHTYYVTSVYLNGESGPSNQHTCEVITNIPEVCVPEYNTGCAWGDGFTDFALAEIENFGSGCADLNGIGWSQYLGLGPAQLTPGETYTVTMGAGYTLNFATVWIDWNDDFEFTEDEQVIFNVELPEAGELAYVDITIPGDAPAGMHIMRARTNFDGDCLDACEPYFYGEAEDYMVLVDAGNPEVCVPEYNTGCAWGDGFTDFALAEIENFGSGCSDLNGIGWSQYLGLGPAQLTPGETYTVTMGAGYTLNFATVWIDWNDDLEFTEDEQVIFNVELPEAGELAYVDITIPGDAPAGMHIMRARTNFDGDCLDACEPYFYGEAEDYMVLVGAGGDLGKIQGFVRDAETNLAIDEAMISAVNSDDETYTSETPFGSHYHLMLPEGNYTVSCISDGYVTGVVEDIEIITGEIINHTFYLEPAKILTGVGDDYEMQTKIYPNPASDKVYIQAEENMDRVQLINISGQLVFEQAVSDSKVEISTVNYESGIYYIKIFSRDNAITRKLVIE